MQTENILRNFFNDPYDIILDFAWPPDCNYGQACQYGFFEKVSDFIQNFQNQKSVYNYEGIINLGLYAACEAGYKDIVMLMIEHGADDFDTGLKIASCHKDIVKLMIEHGADE